MELSTKETVSTGVLIMVLLLGLVVLGMWGCPKYSVYSARMEGQAQLAHAQASKEVIVAEARAKEEAASRLAGADTIRAYGIARSNTIIGQSLTEAYLHWFWIDNLEKNPNAVIYVPTETGLPIFEAGRLDHLPQPKPFQP